MIGQAISRVLELDEIGLSQTLVVGLLSLPVVVEVIISHLCVVLLVTLLVLAILEGKSP